MSFLRKACNGQSDFGGAEIIFGELVANVVRHAPGPIQITARSDSRGSVTLNVFDTGPAFKIAPALPASLSSESGRGLYVISQLCAHLSSIRTEIGNKVSVVLPVLAGVAS
jgi:anti-sigma regulatory factor (Ser/Thr protein kinase)